jgi:hypothetical protein
VHPAKPHVAHKNSPFEGLKMSLGLGDLNKRRRTQKSAPAQKTEPTAGAWARDQIARPWSESGLARPAGSSRRKLVNDEAVMNEEWITVYSGSIFQIELHQDSSIFRLQQKLVAFEERVEAAVRSRLSAFFKFVS